MRIESFLWLIWGTYAEYASFEEGILRGDCKNVKGSLTCFDDCIQRGGVLEKQKENGCTVVPGSITAWHLGNQWNREQANDSLQEYNWISLNKTAPSNCDGSTLKCQTAEDCQSWCAGTKDCAWFSWFVRGGVWGENNLEHRCQGKSQEQVDAVLRLDNIACSDVHRRCDWETCLSHNGATNTCIWRSRNIVGGTLEGSESLIERLVTVNQPPNQKPTPPKKTTEQPTPPKKTTEQPTPPKKTTEQPTTPKKTTEQPTPPKKIVAITVAKVTDAPTDTPTAESNTDATDPTLPTEATNGTIPTEATSQIQDTPSTKASGGSTATKVGAIVGAAGGAGILGVGAYAAFRALGTGASSIDQAQFETLNGANEPNEISRETSVEVSEFI